MKADVKEQLAEGIAALPVVNYHDHAWRAFSPEFAHVFDLPAFFLHTGYLTGDLEAIGFQQPPDLFDYLKGPIDPDASARAWTFLRPYLERARNASYLRYQLRSLQDLFDFREADIFSDGWREISALLWDYSCKHKGDGATLCERMNVRATVIDANRGPGILPDLQTNGHTVVHVARLDMFIHEGRHLADTLEQFPARDFDAWLDAFDSTFHKNIEAGALGFKTALAYQRSLAYSDPTKETAARIFESGILEASPADKTLYQDYMMNRLCRLCVQVDMPLQMHTGIQAGLANTLDDTRPTLLTGLFQRHRDLRVDLFHAGYPWYLEAGLMAKYFPNVYVDGCWVSHISPSVYRAALTAWIETLPMTKIFAWGGDGDLLEQAVGSLAFARDALTQVLTEFVEDGYMDVELALYTARRILHDNGADFWRLNARAQ
jgi:hypothetical protein